LRRTLREFQPDILNPHCPPGHSFLALARGLERADLPLIRSVDDPRMPNRNALNRYLHHSRTDGVLFTTASSLKRYESVFNLRQTRVILPGFRPDDFTAQVQPGGYRHRFGVRDDQLLFGIIARMSPEKGQEVFLEALSLLPADLRARVFCVMAGEDSRERGQADLKAVAARFGVESNVAFLEKLSDVRPLMSELDVGLITSVRSEAICRVALEYMSFSHPVISSDVNILPEVVRNGRTGWIFANHDARGMAACLSEAITQPDERRKRGLAGHELVHGEFSLTHEVEQTLDFYGQITAIRQRGRA
jgi:glycosyltransferase involved in cell wall biosynthesis